MDINIIEQEYDIADKIGNDFATHSRFVKLLLSDNSPDILNCHYGLLKRRHNKHLYLRLRAAFKSRPDAENFLLDKIKTETDPDMLADILHLLGGIKSVHAAQLARQFINSEYKYQREVALYVLGWVGVEGDIALLREHLQKEEDPHLRITAASAHRQIAWHYKELKDAVLKSLKVGFEHEKDDEVLSWIIVMLGTVAVKNLGLREDKEDPYILRGDFEKAKKKAAAFLVTIT